MTSHSLLPVQRIPLILLTAVCLSQCATEVAPPAKTNDGTYWTPEADADAPAKVVISLDEQHVGLFKKGSLVGLSPISSGREGHGTTTGTFNVTEKDEDHRSSWYGAFVDESGSVVQDDVDCRKDKAPPGSKFMGASMNWFMRINGPIGMHQGYLPGYPASHGCIRLPGHMAELFYKATPHGSPVEVRKNADLLSQRPAHAPSVQPQTPELASSPGSGSTPRLSDAISAGMRPVSPSVPGAPPAPMTLAPSRLAPKMKLPQGGQTLYLPGYGPQ